MSNIFNSLNIGYTGLVAAQTGVSTTSHNISNAETEGYTRQRVVTSAATPISSAPGQIGNGVEVTDITRIFDNFVFDRYTEISGDKEYSDFTKTTMEELSTYFPEIDGVGIKSDLQEYYNMWQTFADNPDNESIKLALANQTEQLTQNISATQTKILDLQSSINEQLLVNVTEVNTLAEELANINKSIDLAEAGGGYTANDLRDKRGLIELNLSKLIGSNVSTGPINSDMSSGSNLVTGSYNLSVNGFNIVDGGSFHPIKIENIGSTGFYDLSYERQDGVLLNMSENITGGRIGAILELRGSTIKDTTSGVPTDGILQGYVAEMDAFAATLIESTNNLYASAPKTRMTSNTLELGSDDSIMSSNLNVNKGSFDVVVYDIDGKEVSRRSINIDITTTLSGSAGSNSIQAQMEAISDDNADGNLNNDIDDFLTYSFAPENDGNRIEFIMDTASADKGYTFSIEDKLVDDSFSSGTNFAGALGMSRYFDGSKGSDISLNFDLKNNSSEISAGKSPSDGDNSLALDMVQQQFEKYTFSVGDSTTYDTTIYGMFDLVATSVGVETNRVINTNDSLTAQFNATQQEYSSVSQVSIDEELTNLIKYQTAYGAASKIITTIDQMMQTLLGIKQ